MIRIFKLLTYCSFLLVHFNTSAQFRPIADFSSINPALRNDTLILPADYHFQVLFQEGDTYFNSSDKIPGNNDFTGYVPIEGSSENGYLSVNHERPIGSVSMADIHFDTNNYLWVVDDLQPVDINQDDISITSANCSGTVTSWGTVISCEEATADLDINEDGHLDTGWCFEIDPATRAVRDYGTGKQQKLWEMGNMKHENVTIHPDDKTVYFGEDGNTSCVYKFVADEAQDLTTGTLYTLQLDDPLVGGAPSGTTGTWIQVPNKTQEDQNATYTIAAELGGTYFNWVEDVEIHPFTEEVYFASKKNDRVYRFTDDGETVSNFETFVGGTSYTMQVGSLTVEEDWGTGNDNLAFDNEGNLWVLQDGSNDYIWVVGKEHTQADPDVRIFASIPDGSEPTGITFSPDNRFLFMSIQHPSSGNNTPQIDAAGNAITFDESTTLVIAQRQHLGANAFVTGLENIAFDQAPTVYPNPINKQFQLSFSLQQSEHLTLSIHNIAGQQVQAISSQLFSSGSHQLNIPIDLATGIYFLKMEGKSGSWNQKIVVQK